MNLIDRYDARPAIDSYDKEWLCARARKVSPYDKCLVSDLSDLMDYFREDIGWIAVSSNNIFWDGSKEPLRVIQVPDNRGVDYLTLMNPEIVEKKGSFESQEGCGAIPDKEFFVERSEYVRLKGFTLGAEGIELEYRIGPLVGGMQCVALVQHECNHLDGILISNGKEVEYL